MADDRLDTPQAPPPDLETDPASYYGADRITEDDITLYNPAKMRVERYRFRGQQISTPYNIDEVDPTGARFRRTGHDDALFVAQVSELVS